MTIQEASNKVREFMEMTDNEVAREPAAFEDETELCINLIDEETKELKDALYLNSFPRALDGAADSLFVILFALHKMGIADKLDAMMEEVCRSNMTKLWTKKELYQAEEVFHFTEKHISKEVDAKNERCILVKRISDGKVIKSPSYSPADAKRILMESSPS